jgi:hypothetical protein
MNFPSMPDPDAEIKKTEEKYKRSQVAIAQEKISNVAIQIATQYTALHNTTNDPNKFVQECYALAKQIRPEVERQDGLFRIIG